MKFIAFACAGAIFSASYVLGTPIQGAQHVLGVRSLDINPTCFTEGCRYPADEKLVSGLMKREDKQKAFDGLSEVQIIDEAGTSFGTLNLEATQDAEEETVPLQKRQEVSNGSESDEADSDFDSDSDSDSDYESDVEVIVPAAVTPVTAPSVGPSAPAPIDGSENDDLDFIPTASRFFSYLGSGLSYAWDKTKNLANKAYSGLKTAGRVGKVLAQDSYAIGKKAAVKGYNYLGRAATNAYETVEGVASDVKEAYRGPNNDATVYDDLNSGISLVEVPEDALWDDAKAVACAVGSACYAAGEYAVEGAKVAGDWALRGARYATHHGASTIAQMTAYEKRGLERRAKALRRELVKME